MGHLGWLGNPNGIEEKGTQGNPHLHPQPDVPHILALCHLQQEGVAVGFDLHMHALSVGPVWFSSAHTHPTICTHSSYLKLHGFSLRAQC